MNGDYGQQLGMNSSAAVDPVRGLEAGKGGLFRRSIVKFAVVGVINNAIGYGTFVILSFAGVTALVAMTVSYLMGMGISFAGNRKWTFGHSGRWAPALWRFLAINVIGYGLNFGILTLFVVTWRFPQIPVQLFALVLVAGVTFLLMRLWAFRGPSVELEDVLKK